LFERVASLAEMEQKQLHQTILIISPEYLLKAVNA